MNSWHYSLRQKCQGKWCNRCQYARRASGLDSTRVQLLFPTFTQRIQIAFFTLHTSKKWKARGRRQKQSNSNFDKKGVDNFLIHLPDSIVRTSSDDQIRSEARRVDRSRGQVTSYWRGVNNGRAARQRQRLRAHFLGRYDDGTRWFYMTRVGRRRPRRSWMWQRYASTRVLDYRRISVNHVAKVIWEWSTVNY